MKANLGVFSVGNGFFALLFQLKEDKEVIFRNDPYFFGSKGMNLNKWALDFNLVEGIPNAMPMSVKLPRLPLSFLCNDFL